MPQTASAAVPTGLNETLFLKINAGADAAPATIHMATLLAKDAVLLVPLLLALLWLSGNAKKRAAALETVAVVALALALGNLVALAYPHPRPFAIGLGHQYLPHAANASFPSDHATFFAAAAFALLAGRSYVTGLLVFLAGVAVDWSRIYLGVHFPFDMLGALGVSLLALAILHPLWARLGARVTALAESVFRKLFKPLIDRGWLRP